MSDLFNVSTNPHVRSKDTTQTIMRDVLIALTPASIFGIYNFGLGALLRIVIGIAVCVAAEGAYQYFMHKKVTISDLSAAVTGLLIALNVPPTLNIGYEIVGCLFAIIIVKQLFGGLGQNFMNPALAARCFLLIAYTGPMTKFVYDGVAGATPLAVLKPGGEAEGAVKLLDMFIGRTGGVIGETSVLFLLIGAIYLLVRKVISIRIPAAYILTFAVLIFLFAPGHQFDVLYTAEQICRVVRWWIAVRCILYGNRLCNITDYTKRKACIWCDFRTFNIHLQNVRRFSRRCFLCNYLLEPVSTVN